MASISRQVASLASFQFLKECGQCAVILDEPLRRPMLTSGV